MLQRVAACCSVLQRVAVHCDTLVRSVAMKPGVHALMKSAGCCFANHCVYAFKHACVCACRVRDSLIREFVTQPY